ncbi:Transcription factor, putative [Giardia lamblia P15]|uniref:Transcription factor, putative n=1 Tax=Giardia intestinalis (strain P15) TaxID=658858 RepID=E1F2H6_GIAIA|nr:Transcription factor, putative [Giardia lamblia P15]
MGSPRITVRVRTVHSADNLGVIDDKGELMTVLLCGIRTPKYNSKDPGTSEPYGYFAREFLRKKLAGHRIQLEITKELQPSPRRVLANAFISGAYINEQVLLAGWGTVIDAYVNQYVKKYLSQINASLDLSLLTSEEILSATHLSEQHESPKSTETRLVEAQLKARFIKHSGMYSGDESLSLVPTIVDTPVTQLLTQHKNQELLGSVEYVKDASYFVVLIQLKEVPLTCAKVPCKPFGIVTAGESDPLNSCMQEVQDSAITLLSGKTVRVIPMLANGNSLLCKVTICTSGTKDNDYAYTLLSKGYAQGVDWMLDSADSIKELYNKAEELAKSKQLGIWKNADHITQEVVDKEVSAGELKRNKQYTGTVVDVPSSDSIIIRLNDGSSLRAWFSSLLTPKCVILKDSLEVEEAGFNLREYLRKNYIGCYVIAHLDYLRDPPKSKDNLLSRPYFSIYLQDDGSNIALALIRNAGCRVIRHPVSETNRSRDYALMLEAESESQSEKHQESNTHTTKNMLKVIDYSSLTGNSKMQIQHFARDHNGCYQAVVDSVISGNRFRIYMSSKCGFIQVVMIAVAGIVTPSVKRREALSAEALGYARNTLLMKDIKVTFTGVVDQRTNALFAKVSFICKDGQEKDFGESLLERGLGELVKGKAASESGLLPAYLHNCTALENNARKKRMGLFKFYIDYKDSIISNPGSWTFPKRYDIHGLQFLDNETFVFRLKDSEKTIITKEMLDKAGTKALHDMSSIFVKQIIVYYDTSTDEYLRARVESLVFDSDGNEGHANGSGVQLYLLDIGKNVFLEDTQNLYAPIPDELLTSKPTTATAKLALLQRLKKGTANKRSIDQEFQEFFDYIKHNIVGVDLICYSCGYDRDGLLNVFLFDENTQDVEIDDPSGPPIDVVTSITGKVISNGLAKLISDEDIPANANVYYEVLTDTEKEAFHARRGLWK